MNYDKAYFKGKTVVVTGAASGVGLALVEELLGSDAAWVVMADINRENLDKHEKRLNESYADRVKGIVCDVTVEEDVQKLIAGSADFFGGRIDLLFNNAGAGFGGWFDEMTNEDWKIAFDLNFYSALYGMRAVLPVMLEQGGGQIINVISGIAFSPMAYQSRYTATKAALNAMTLALRTEYWDRNIKISAATPGTTATAIWGDFDIPDTAQSPQLSAERILNGTVHNDRVIFGDETDAQGAACAYNLLYQEGNDKYLLRVARERLKGEMAI